MYFWTAIYQEDIFVFDRRLRTHMQRHTGHDNAKKKTDDLPVPKKTVHNFLKIKHILA